MMHLYTFATLCFFKITLPRNYYYCDQDDFPWVCVSKYVSKSNCCHRHLVLYISDVKKFPYLPKIYISAIKRPIDPLHISLIVSSKGAIWGDDSVDLRFIVLHGELRSQQGALDVFLSLMTGATLKCKQFSCAKGKKLRSTECPPTLY